MIKNILLLLIAIIIWLAYMHEKNQDSMPTFGDSSQPATVIPDFGCMGKKTCAEMASCEEAKFYLAQCPDTGQLDPDNDGIPCEDLCTNQ